MKKNMCELQRELETMLEKRSQIRSKQMERYRNGSATRAMTTTSNAAADRIIDRIIWLRDQLEKMENKHMSEKTEKGMELSNACQDLTPRYLDQPDYALARKE